MRLTLRTLLAYLDDTLQPNEIKEIGQKVAESEAAQELIARIKAVTRRRRLTTPPASGPNARFDANDVADYLDNELSAEEVAELEKICLESDVHLAEMAACHQILTLVLGEPALVPPTARERMYKLVQGREAIPYRKAAPTAATAEGIRTREEDSIPGLGGGWLKWTLPLAGLFLMVALGLAFWQVVSDSPRPRGLSGRTGDDIADGRERPDDKGKDDKGKDDKGKDDKGKDDKGKDDKGKDDKGREKDRERPSETDKNGKPPEREKDGNVPEREKEKDKPKAPEPGPGVIKPVDRVPAPNPEKVPIGRYVANVGGRPSVLIHRQAGKDTWQRYTKGQPVGSGEPLVCMPGYLSEVQTATGITLTLCGHVREFSQNPLMDFLMESAVTLHKSEDVDLDLTLDRGRIFLRSDKETGQAKVRLRFAGEAWEVTLPERGAEFGVDLFKHYTRDIKYREGEEPRAELYLCVLRKEAGLNIDAFHSYKLDEPPGPALFLWDSFTKARGPIRLKELPSVWNKLPPDNQAARDMTLALKDLELRLKPGRAVENALLESFDKTAPMPRLLALYSLSAVDDVSKLIDILGDEDPTRALDRNMAIFALRRYLSRGGREGLLLHDEKEKKGLLIDKRYRNSEADIVFTLLHDFTDEERMNPDTYELLAGYLGSKKVGIAELAHWHLLRLSLGVRLPDFNAAWPVSDREKVGELIKDLVVKKRLPPPPPAPIPER